MENPFANVSDHTKLVVREVLAIILVLIIAGVLALKWFEHLEDMLPKPAVGVQVIATPAKEVKSIPKARAIIKNGSVSVYASPAKVDLKLPDAIKDDPLQHVLASNQVTADDHPQTITTVINSDTGESQTFVRRDPLPWLAWDDHGELGIYAGIKNGTPAARLEAKQGIFQVKAVHFGAIGSVDQPLQGPLQPDYYIGVGAWYRW